MKIAKENTEDRSPFGLNQFARELMAEGAYDSLANKLTKQTINQWKKDLAERNPKSKKKSTSFIDLDIDEVDAKGRELEFNFFLTSCSGFVIEISTQYNYFCFRCIRSIISTTFIPSNAFVVI